MTRHMPILAAIVLAGAVGAASVVPLAAKVKIKTEYDKKEKIKPIATWTWLEDPKVIGASVNPDVVNDARFSQEVLSPPVKAIVERAMAAKGYRLAGAGETADAQVAVYLIGTADASSQTLGQFMSYNTGWPILMSGYTPSQSLRIYEKGTIVFDVIDPAKKTAVWRATAVGEIDRQRTQEQRLATIEGVVRDVLKKFPPK